MYFQCHNQKRILNYSVLSNQKTYIHDQNEKCNEANMTVHISKSTNENGKSESLNLRSHSMQFYFSSSHPPGMDNNQDTPHICLWGPVHISYSKYANTITMII